MCYLMRWQAVRGLQWCPESDLQKALDVWSQVIDIVAASSLKKKGQVRHLQKKLQLELKNRMLHRLSF